MSQKAFKALGDPTRLHIVELLSKVCCCEAPVDEEAATEPLSAGEVCCHVTGAGKITSTVSHHLHELEDAGLIEIERRGKRMICILKPQALENLAEYLRELAKGVGECC